MRDKTSKVIEILEKYMKPEWEKFAGVLLTYLLKLKLALIILVLLIIIDFITGVIASIKRKEKIISSRIFDTIIKMYVYYGVILTFVLVEVALKIEFLSYIAISFAILTEAKSIIENYAIFMPDVLKLNKYFKVKDEGNKEDNSALHR